MYSIRSLPLLPAETRAGYIASSACEFVDPVSVEIVVNRWTTPHFRNQTYHGGDFAGRDDASSPLDPSLFPHRSQLGPFFLKAFEQSGNNALAYQLGSPQSEVDPLSSKVMKHRHRVSAAAAFICVGLFFLGYFTKMFPPFANATPSLNSGSKQQLLHAEHEIISHEWLTSNEMEKKKSVTP